MEKSNQYGAIFQFHLNGCETLTHLTINSNARCEIILPELVEKHPSRDYYQDLLIKLGKQEVVMHDVRFTLPELKDGEEYCYDT